MKINIILSLLMTCTFLANTPSYAMDSLFLDLDETKKSGATVHPSFEEQVEKVASYFIQPRNAQGLPVKMALGASPYYYKL